MEVLLISVGTITGLSSLLAILMVIADATIANYGTVKLSVNEDREYSVKGGRPLLATLMDEGVFIPSACGGRGSCGLCKLTVLDGAGQLLPTELPWLSPEERESSVRLSCQVKMKNDFKIQIPEALFSVKEFKTKVSRIRDLTHDIKEVSLEIVDGQEIEYKAGQFVQFKVPEYKLTDEPVYRAYSMASIPSGRSRIQLHIRKVPNGIATTYVHQFLKEGDSVTFNGPHGEFFLSRNECELIFIAGGSGMAPIKSILLDMEERGDTRRARYYFGARQTRDLFLIDEMKSLEGRLANFEFIPVLSEPEEGDGWTGRVGLVTEALEQDVKRVDNTEAYLCGSPGMLDACIKVLDGIGIPDSKIFFDKFG